MKLRSSVLRILTGNGVYQLRCVTIQLCWGDNFYSASMPQLLSLNLAYQIKLCIFSCQQTKLPEEV